MIRQAGHFRHRGRAACRQHNRFVTFPADQEIRFGTGGEIHFPGIDGTVAVGTDDACWHGEFFEYCNHIQPSGKCKHGTPAFRLLGEQPNPQFIQP